MSDDTDNEDDSVPTRSSISVSGETKQRFNTLRRQYSAAEDEDKTGDDTLALLLDEFEERNEWANTDG